MDILETQINEPYEVTFVDELLGVDFNELNFRLDLDEDYIETILNDDTIEVDLPDVINYEKNVYIQDEIPITNVKNVLWFKTATINGKRVVNAIKIKIGD